MLKIAIIENAIGLNNEKGYSRFRYLPKLLAGSYGMDVEVITSTFQHWEKKQRNIDRTLKNQSIEKYKTTLLYEPGYKKNIDYRRIISHYIFANNVIKHLNRNKYDLIYCTIPDNRLAAKVARFAHKNSIKVIIDIEDLWPEVMEMAINLPKIVNKILYYPLRKYAYIAFKYADAFVGTSDEYRDYPAKKYGQNNKEAKTVYVGCDLEEFDEGVKEYRDLIKKNNNEFWITYAGTLGASYDLKTFLLAVGKAQLLYPEIIAIILGGGPDEQILKKIAKDNHINAVFVGYVPYKKMAAYLHRSDIVINSFVRSAPQSIVNKIGDYLASGRPMINTCSSIELKNKVENDGFGRNVIAEDIPALTDLIIKMYKDKESLIQMGHQARNVAERDFDRKVSYRIIADLIVRQVCL